VRITRIIGVILIVYGAFVFGILKVDQTGIFWRFKS
jgi:hypothetical protein